MAVDDEVVVVALRGERPRSETVLADQNPQAIFQAFARRAT